MVFLFSGPPQFANRSIFFVTPSLFFSLLNRETARDRWVISWLLLIRRSFSRLSGKGFRANRKKYQEKWQMKILEILFGCKHPRLSFPMSARRGEYHTPAARETGAYVVCLDCGREFAYDWQQMQIVSEKMLRSHTPASLEAKADAVHLQ
jgi:hypothetical protein